MTHAKFNSNRLMLTLIFRIRVSEPPWPGEGLKRPDLIGLSQHYAKDLSTFLSFKEGLQLPSLGQINQPKWLITATTDNNRYTVLSYLQQSYIKKSTRDRLVMDKHELRRLQSLCKEPFSKVFTNKLQK